MFGLCRKLLLEFGDLCCKSYFLISFFVESARLSDDFKLVFGIF